MVLLMEGKCVFHQKGGISSLLVMFPKQQVSRKMRELEVQRAVPRWPGILLQKDWLLISRRKGKI